MDTTNDSMFSLSPRSLSSENHDKNINATSPKDKFLERPKYLLTGENSSYHSGEDQILYNSGKCIVDNKPIFYTGCGEDDADHMHGVAILVEVYNSVTNFLPISERVTMLQLSTSNSKLILIQIYTPTTNEEDYERFYQQLSDLLG